MDDPPAVVVPGQLIEAPDRSEVLGIARRLEFRIGQSQIVAVKLRVLAQLAGQQAQAAGRVGQGCEIRFPAIGRSSASISRSNRLEGGCSACSWAMRRNRSI